MLSNAAWLKTLKVSNKTPATCHRVRAYITSFLIVLASVAIANAASAVTLYDGDPSYRVSVRIARGAIDSSDLEVAQGHVTSREGVKVTVRSRNQWAYGGFFIQKPRSGNLEGPRHQWCLRGYQDGGEARIKRSC
jgi:hypothetical protein